jgi:hypothetical protein
LARTSEPDPVLYGAHRDAGVDAAEAERVAEQRRYLAIPATWRDDIEVTGGIQISEVGGSG